MYLLNLVAKDFAFNNRFFRNSYPEPFSSCYKLLLHYFVFWFYY